MVIRDLQPKHDTDYTALIRIHLRLDQRTVLTESWQATKGQTMAWEILNLGWKVDYSRKTQVPILQFRTERKYFVVKLQRQIFIADLTWGLIDDCVTFLARISGNIVYGFGKPHLNTRVQLQEYIQQMFDSPQPNKVRNVLVLTNICIDTLYISPYESDF